MSDSLVTNSSLYRTLAGSSRAASFASATVIVVLGSLLLAVAAQIKVPVVPVPFTLATLAVAMIAGTFGARIGVATVALYIAEGLAGLPVFSNGGGLAYLASPTFGFIIGYLALAMVIGWAADAGLSRRPLAFFAAMIAGNIVMLGFGFVWLLSLASGAAWIDQSNVVGSAFAVAVQPFLIWDGLKMAFAAITIAGLWAAFGKRA
ncbi:biotin transport system substrate-specific component [Devosia enhydra]|uniref:Biotin transporter n=1 Tax=Devosia enhydra TaxID=665118 RepID=A0A1K2I0Z8_9HYPH|nr:biotin transporter BioY [Devosia enhydra]SFZ86054.1 biotin transport system substrate-specific component [Devosia enhydra]